MSRSIAPAISHARVTPLYEVCLIRKKTFDYSLNKVRYVSGEPTPPDSSRASPVSAAGYPIEQTKSKLPQLPVTRSRYRIMAAVIEDMPLDGPTGGYGRYQLHPPNLFHNEPNEYGHLVFNRTHLVDFYPGIILEFVGYEDVRVSCELRTRRYPSDWDGPQVDEDGLPIPDHVKEEEKEKNSVWRYSVVLKVTISPDQTPHILEFRIRPKLDYVDGAWTEMAPGWIDLVNVLRQQVTTWHQLIPSIRPLPPAGCAAWTHVLSKGFPIEKEVLPIVEQEILPAVEHQVAPAIEEIPKPVVEQVQVTSPAIDTPPHLVQTYASPYQQLQSPGTPHSVSSVPASSPPFLRSGLGSPFGPHNSPPKPKLTPEQIKKAAAAQASPSPTVSKRKSPNGGLSPKEFRERMEAEFVRRNSVAVAYQHLNNGYLAHPSFSPPQFAPADSYLLAGANPVAPFQLGKRGRDEEEGEESEAQRRRFV